ncbi:uncharacterized protein P884DRAFT_269316 [Thermothelomyces heterothallicus CBS 202.75]|uniref:uncharacterized protein n=1 Tax=Thermothelomyces heterothallicus CBS 202.75 TaxID=1149848 RepID=UPI003742475D
MASAAQADPEMPVTVKASLDGVTRRFKLPLRDVNATAFESKVRSALNLPADTEAVFERYSDSAGAYIALDQPNTAVYKQMYRAAKAKHKLKLRVTVKKAVSEEEGLQDPTPTSAEDGPEEQSGQVAETVEPTGAGPEPEVPTESSSSSLPADAEFLRPASAVEKSTTEFPLSQLRSVQEVLEEYRPKPEEVAPPAPSNPSSINPMSGVALCPAMQATYAVCCNSCDKTIPDAHYHCSTCDDGDFDLCQDCVDYGVTCKGTNHWLIKRFVKNGVIINSTTERLAPRPKPKEQPPKPAPSPLPAAPERIVPVFNDKLYSCSRTCNCCVQEFPEAEFVHCTSCDDYDLCRVCFVSNRHGHHPKHAFVPAVEGTRLDHEVARRLAAGRGQPHNAICDGCDKAIRGVRHKCLDCPDWDYCSGCVVNAKFIHPGHRFVPIYEPLEYDGGFRARSMNRPVHVGICCDGPLCSAARANSAYIVGDRYKCAVCHDTDFCASCEASPSNTHNRTHPLIKFKSPVRHVSVTTTGENMNGRQMPTMGDRPRTRPPPAASIRTAERSTSPSLFTGVQTVVDVVPSEPVKAEEKQPEQAGEETPAEKQPEAERTVEEAPASIDDLAATFVRDTVQDGTTFQPDHVFEQTWVLRNTGKVAWPAGCSVKFVSGDYMGHLDSNHPAATRDVEFSCESTVCYAPVQPGAEYPFTVLLRTPSRSGRFVSNWRLTTKDGHRFGHRLWCDIVVEKPRVALPPPPPPPTTTTTMTTSTDAEPVKVAEETKEVSKPEPEVKMEHSEMIFPKLEKESPVASVHEEAKDESVSGLEDEYEDCQDVEWAEGDSDEGFLTDEEYDVLDASDEEFNLPSRPKQK